MFNFSGIFFTVVLLITSGFSILNAEDEEIFSSEDHCVAYATPEKIMFFPDYLVIGKSCEVYARTENNGNKSRFIVDIPVASLDSGVSARDNDVVEILEADNFPNLRFKTDWFHKVKINNFLLDGQGEVSGVLVVSGREYPISFNMIFSKKGQNYLIRGEFETNYTFFDLTPPEFGIFAEVVNKIKIAVNLQSENIIGFEKTINTL